jgi:hypothetical protein
MGGSIIYSLMAEIVNQGTPTKGDKLKQSPIATNSGDPEADSLQVVPAGDEESSQVATAFGLSGCLVNATFFVTPIFVAWLITGGSQVPVEGEEARAYKPMEVFYTMVSLCGFLGAVALRMTVKRRY